MLTGELIHILEEMFPVELQEGFDNSGGQIVFYDQEISSILLALDADASVLDEAIATGASVIITHHPFIFKPLKSISTIDSRSAMALKAIDNRISIYSLHTNLDKIYSWKLGALFELTDAAVVVPENTGAASIAPGIGIRGKLKHDIRLRRLLVLVKEVLSLDFLLYTGDPAQVIKTIAVLNGSGGRNADEVLMREDVDCVITGDAGYHQMKLAEEKAKALIDAGHFGTEHVFLHFLKKDIQDFLTKTEKSSSLQIRISETEKNPLTLFTD